MGWDLYVMDLPPEVTHVEEVPGSFRPPLIGKRAAIIARILEIVPDANFSNPEWGTIDGDEWSIEVNMGGEDLDSFVFHVRGGDGAVTCIGAILQHLRLRALDPGSDTGIFSGGSESLAQWRVYRDQICGE
jgi:hypothetical protein